MNGKTVSAIMLTMLIIGISTVAFSVTTRAEDDVTTHFGDLIIDGNEIFMVENCTYIQTGNIHVKENGTLAIKDAELVMEMSRDWEYNIYIYDTARLIVEDGNVSTPILFDIYFFDRSSGHLSNSIIGGGWGKLGYVCLEIWFGSLSDIFIKNPSVYYVRTYSDSSTIIVTESSDITCFSILWMRCSLDNQPHIRLYKLLEQLQKY